MYLILAGDSNLIPTNSFTADCTLQFWLYCIKFNHHHITSLLLPHATSDKNVTNKVYYNLASTSSSSTQLNSMWVTDDGQVLSVFQNTSFMKHNSWTPYICFCLNPSHFTSQIKPSFLAVLLLLCINPETNFRQTDVTSSGKLLYNDTTRLLKQ